MFTKLDQFADMLKLFLRLRAADIGPVLEAAQAILASDDLKVQVQQALVIAEIVARYIPGEADDAAVHALQALAQHDQIWVLVEIVQRLITGEELPTTETAVPVALLEALPAGVSADDVKALPWQGIFQLATLVAKVITKLRKDEEV